MPIDVAQLGISVRADGVLVATKNLDQLEKASKRAESAAERLAKQTEKVGKSMRDVGRNLSLYVTTPLIAIAGIAVKTASDFESSFADIRKTVDATEGQFAQMADEMRALAMTVPTTVEELNRIGGVAGQLGIAQENIVEFTRVIAMLGDTTDVAGEEAALSLTRFMNIMGTAQGDIDRVGSTVVGLGNKFAAMESEIINTATSLAAFGSQMKLTEADVLAFATAIAASGGETEAASTAFQKTASTMQRAVLEMNEDLAIFANTAGVTASEFARAFREDAAGAILLFLRGLERISDQGLSTAAVLEELGLADQRLQREFGKVVGNLDQLDDALVRSTQEWEKNTALTEEAEKRYKTFASEMAIFRNQIKDVAIELGTALLPHIRAMRDDADGLVATMRSWVKAFKDADVETQKQIISTVAWAAAAGPLLIVLGNVVRIIGFLTPSIVRLSSVLVTLTTSVVTTTQAISKFGLGLVALNAQAAISTSRLLAFAGPMGVAVGAVVLLIPRLLEAADNAKTLAEAIDLSSDAADRFAVAIEKATTVSELDDELQEIRSAATLLERELIKINEELSVFPDHPDTQSNPLFQRLLEEKERVSAALMDLQEDYNNLRGKQRELVAEAEQGAAALADVAAQAIVVGDSFDADALQKLLNYLEPSVQAMRSLAEARELLNAARGKLGEEEFQRLAELLERSDLAFKAFADRIGSKRVVNPQILADFESWSKWLDEINEEQEEFNRRLQDLRDIGDPVAALVRTLTLQMQDLDRAVREGTISERERQVILNVLTDELGKAAAATMDLTVETDLLREAALEATRQMTQAFLGMWQDILRGGENAFDGLLDGLRSVLAQMTHAISTARIGEELNNALDDVDGNFDFKNLAGGVAAAISTAIGAEIGGGGQGASMGAAIGGAIGSIWGPIGQAIGALLGGLAGGLFDRDPRTTIGGANFAGAGPQHQSIVTPLGEVQSIHARGGVGGFLEPGTFGESAGQAINELDAAIFELLDSIGGDEQLAVIQDALANWGITLSDGAVTIENILESRFDAILATFDADVQSFVGLASDFEGQVKRFDVAVRSQSLFEKMPELFSGRTLDDFLSVVDAFAGGTVDITEAFELVIEQIQKVAVAQQLIRDFADGDFIADYERMVMLQNETPVDTLSRLSSDLFDAVANFDNTPEQLVEIANAFGTIGEAGVNAIAHIDAAWKGLTATIDRLRQDTLDIIAGPKSEREIFVEAAGLVDLAKTAQTPEELSRLVAQFDSLIRSLTPETAQRLGDNLIDLIDRFQGAADTSFERVRDQTLNAIASMQTMADAFMTRIPDALALVASTNERAAMALEAIAGVEGSTSSITGISGSVDTTAISNVMGASFANQEQILVNGTSMMADALRSGTANLQQNIASAIQSGFGNARIVVNVQIADNGLANQ